MTRWQAIVFDLDDTLYPERDYVLGGFRAVAAWAEPRLGLPADRGFAELRSLFEQGVRGDTFNRWLLGHGLDAALLIAEIVRVYREHQPALQPFPEMPKLLHGLRESARLGLVSDGYLDVQRRKLAALGIERYFDAIVFSDEWGRTAWKPSTQPFEAVLRRMDAAAGAAVYVADNPTKDFLGARRAGMSTIWLHRPGGGYAHLCPPTLEHAPDLTVTTPAELAEVLTEKASIL